MNLPTEEDVLAALLLRWLANEDGDPEEWLSSSIPSSVYSVTGDRAPWCCSRDVFEMAIADSERRLEAERAVTALLGSVDLWRLDGCGSNWLRRVREDAERVATARIAVVRP